MTSTKARAEGRHTAALKITALKGELRTYIRGIYSMCSRHTTRVPHLFHEDSWTNWMILSKQVEYQPASCLTPGGEQENPKSLIHLHINTAFTVTGGITQIKWWVICKHEWNSFFFKLNNDYDFRGRSFFVSAACLAAVTTCRGSFSYLLRQRPPCSFTWK